MYPPTDTPIDPLGLPPAPAAPALPQPAQPKSMNPIAKSVLVALAAMAGPGRGTGILQGLSLADQQAQARAQQQNALAVQDYTRQHQAYQDEQRTYQQQQQQRAATLKNVLDSFQMELGNTTSDAEAESLYQTAGQLLSAQGFRGFDAASLKRKYKSPDMALRANKAIAKWMANPINKQAFDNDPESIGRITIDVGGAPMTIAQAQTMTGGAAPTAKPKTATPRQPVAVGSFEDYLARTFGENPTSAQILQARKDYNQADDRARASGNGPRDRFSIQQITNPDGTTGLVRVNLETNEVSPVTLPSGAGAGRPTEKNQSSADYLGRTYAADADAASFEGDLSKLGAQMNVQIPNMLRSPKGQLYRAAQDEFINAGLRDESGAAIQPSEYDRYRAIYFAVPGDTAETIKRKQQARERVIKGLRSKAGNLAAGVTPPVAPLPSHGDNTVTIGGKKFGVQVIP